MTSTREDATLYRTVEEPQYLGWYI